MTCIHNRVLHHSECSPSSKCRWGTGFRSRRSCNLQSRLKALPSNLLRFQEQDIETLTSLGEQTSSASSATPKEAATAALLAAAESLGKQSIEGNEGGAATVEVQLLEGKITTGEHAGTSVVLKVYPPETGSNADLLFRNEIAAHGSLQQRFLGATVPGSERIVHLLGCFRKPTGEQVLVFCKQPGMTAEECCRRAAAALFRGADAQNAGFWEEPRQVDALRRRKRLIKAAVVQLLEGLAYTHRRERVHRRLTPDNLLLAWGDAGPERLSLQLMDLSLSADISDACMLGGATLAALWHGQKERDNPLKALADPLWERAATVGATSAREQQLFAVAEDVSAAGLLVAYLAFAPLCEPGSIDFPTIQRLLGVAFQADVGAAREYCGADERWALAVAFLDEDVGAGWDLIQSMTFPDFRLRPAAEACLKHPFLSSGERQ